jgi:urease beta subunit
MFWLVSLLLSLFMLSAGADESAVLVKGVFQGKLQDKTFEQPFEMRLEPGERRQVRVEMEGTDLEVALEPRWHYPSGSATPDSMFMNVYLKCRNEQLRIQRGSVVRLQPAEKKTVELNDKDAENIFTVELEAQSAPGEE